MKPALKYALISILYEAGESGIWEYDMYELLRDKYEKSSICSMREELVGFSNIGWLSVLAIRQVDGYLLRKYRLQKRHREFIRYQLEVENILRDLQISRHSILAYQESPAPSVV